MIEQSHQPLMPSSPGDLDALQRRFLAQQVMTQRIELPLPHDVFHFHHQRPAHQTSGPGL